MLSHLKKWAKEEFVAQNFEFSYPNTKPFYKSSIDKPRWYFAWRVLSAIYHVSGIFLIAFNVKIKYIYYISSVSYLLMTFHSCLDLVVVLYCHNKQHSYLSGLLPWYIKLSWLFFTIFNCTALLSSFMHLVSQEEEAGVYIWLACVFNSVYVFLNMAVTATPVRLLHVAHCITFCFAYILTTAIYGLLSTDNLYRTMRWGEDFLAAALHSVLILVIIVPFNHCVVIYGLYRLRLFLCDKLQVRLQASSNKISPRSLDASKN